MDGCTFDVVGVVTRPIPPMLLLALHILFRVENLEYHVRPKPLATCSNFQSSCPKLICFDSMHMDLTTQHVIAGSLSAGRGLS